MSLFFIAMPTYEFECNVCQKRFAKNLPIGTKSAPCEICGEEALKVFVAPAISFRGSGFYASDSRSGGAAETKTDSKPAEESSSAGGCCSGKPGCSGSTASPTD